LEGNYKKINSIISLYIKADYDLIKSCNADEDANDAKSWETKEDHIRARVYSRRKISS